MFRRRMIVLLSVVVCVAVAVTVAVARHKTGGSQTSQEKAETRRLVLILADVSPQSDSAAFDLESAARSEALIAQCMRGHGYQYTPKDPRSLVDPTTSTDFASLAYAKEYGFGISAFPNFLPATADVAYVTAMTDQARDAYDSLLSTCANNAQAETNTEFGVQQANTTYTAIDGEVQNDARYRSALQTWSRCATAAGYPAASRLDLIMRLRTTYDTVMAKVQSGLPASASQDQVAAAARADPGWQAFHRTEVEAATATFGCSQTTDKVYAAVFMDYLNNNA